MPYIANSNRVASAVPSIFNMLLEAVEADSKMIGHRMAMKESTTQADGRMHLAVFTDLDGSLLDHHTYSFADARPALGRIREQRIPLVFVTSKTRPEVERLQATLGIREPTLSLKTAPAILCHDRYRGWRRSMPASVNRPTR